MSVYDLGAIVDEEEDNKEFWSNLGPRIDEDLICLSFFDKVGKEWIELLSFQLFKRTLEVFSR